MPTREVKLRTFKRRHNLEKNIEQATQQLYERNKQLADTNKALSLLRAIDTLALEPFVGFKEICQQICQIITSVNEYEVVGLMAAARHDDDHLKLLGLSASSKVNVAALTRAPARIDIQNEAWLQSRDKTRLMAIGDLDVETLAKTINKAQMDVEILLKNTKIKSIFLIKLKARHRLIGVIAVGFLEGVEEVSKSDLLTLESLSESIGLALYSKLLFEENKRVLSQLKQSNSKLVNLDEVKDDFISMASHQLRTPLTSVKGYLSMVLEGDAGKLSPTQTNMLNQAFASCQRMVYIIADLLNVSRLRTGKFLIEPGPVNLSQTVGDEIDQLKEIAKAKNVNIVYNQPKSFPTLMLDEGKVREVVMNFIDNAIYYTGDGGKIEVSVKNKQATVEVCVKDNGIGVPRSERAHLFTKFYRASNARKARPDGTGLGLYMAKKIIIAQGGAIIFESEENKGSTFGFMFNKQKLSPKPQSNK